MSKSIKSAAVKDLTLIGGYVIFLMLLHFLLPVRLSCV